MSEVSVFILAGGRSSRMGTDKALLRLDGETLLERAIRKAREVSHYTAVVGARELYGSFGAEIVEDEFPGCGPLGGIHAALTASRHEWNLILSVDTPFVPAAFLRYLSEQALHNCEAIAIVPRAGGEVQGTCAAYRRPFLVTAQQQLLQGRYRITEALSLVQTKYLEEAEIAAAGLDAAMFANLNTPEDFALYSRDIQTGNL